MKAGEILFKKENQRYDLITYISEEEMTLKEILLGL